MRQATRDLAGDKGFAAPGAFVIKQDAVAGIDTLGLAVVDAGPIGVQFGHCIRAARMKWRQFCLW